MLTAVRSSVLALLSCLSLSVSGQTAGDPQLPASGEHVEHTAIPLDMYLRRGSPPASTHEPRMTGNNDLGSAGGVYTDGSMGGGAGVFLMGGSVYRNIYNQIGSSAYGYDWRVANLAGFPVLWAEAPGGVKMAVPPGFTTANPGSAALMMWQTSNQDYDVISAYGGGNSGGNALFKLRNGEGTNFAASLTLFHDGVTQTLLNGSATAHSYFGGKLSVGKTGAPGSGVTLDVSGTLHADTIASTALTATTVTATTVTATNGITAVYQDLAEWVPASEQVDAGTVVVVDPDASNRVSPSSKAYQTSVAGVVSLRPGVLLGMAGAGKVKIATTGRVLVKVDASRGAIRRGDLLVTSDRRGLAMKSQPVSVGGLEIHRPGTLVGKALEPLAEGQGEILVLLSLQ